MRMKELMGVSSIGDEDKERMTMVSAVVPPRQIAELVEAQAQENRGPTLRGAARSGQVHTSGEDQAGLRCRMRVLFHGFRLASW